MFLSWCGAQARDEFGKVSRYPVKGLRQSISVFRFSFYTNTLSKCVWNSSEMEDGGEETRTTCVTIAEHFIISLLITGFFPVLVSCLQRHWILCCDLRQASDDSFPSFVILRQSITLISSDGEYFSNFSEE